MRCSGDVRMYVCVCTHEYLQSSVKVWVHVLWGFFLLHVCKRQRDCGFLYYCQRVHMFGSETGWIQHSLRSLQSQAFPSGCEHLVNTLWPLYHPCILTSIAVERLLTNSVVNVKSLLLDAWGSPAQHAWHVTSIKSNDITKCCYVKLACMLWLRSCLSSNHTSWS